LDEKRKLKEMSTPDQGHAGSSTIPSQTFLQELVDDERRDGFVADSVRTRLALLIRALREQNGWSQAELGCRLGKPQSVVSRLEDPDYKLSLQTLFEVARAFRLPLYVDMPNWDEWFRLMEDMSSRNLRRQGFDPTRLVALANVPQVGVPSFAPAAAIEPVASAHMGILSTSGSGTELGKYVLIGQQSWFGKTGGVVVGTSVGGTIYSQTSGGVTIGPTSIVNAGALEPVTTNAAFIGPTGSGGASPGNSDTLPKISQQQTGQGLAA
jgi:transcriptional regulator with XRE-family HTH domain